MIWQQSLDEIRAHIAALEHDLAEVDALVCAHAGKIDPAPSKEWPRGSTLGKAMARHELRLLHEAAARRG